MAKQHPQEGSNTLPVTCQISVRLVETSCGCGYDKTTPIATTSVHNAHRLLGIHMRNFSRIGPLISIWQKKYLPIGGVMAKPHPYTVNNAHPVTWNHVSNFIMISPLISFWQHNFLWVWLRQNHTHNALIILIQVFETTFQIPA